MRTFDAIFIGAGHNSLVGAAELAKDGWSVLVLERADRPGGFVRTDELTLPGFKHDVYSSLHPGFYTGPAYELLRDDLEAHGMTYVTSQRGLAALRQHGDGIVTTGDPQHDAEAAEALEPGDGDRYLALLDLSMPFMERLVELFLCDIGSARGRELAAELSADSTFQRNTQRTLRHALDDIGPRSDTMRRLIAGTAQHFGPGPGPDDPGGAFLFPLMLGGFFRGGPMPVGGSGELARALAEIVVERGGEIRCDSEAAHIELRDGAAREVVLADGERFEARRAIVASVTPDQLYLRMLDASDVPSPLREQAGRYEFGRGMVQVSLALSESPDLPDERLAGGAMYMLCDGLDAVAKSVAEGGRDELPAEPPISFDVPSDVDPSRAPEGKAVVRLQATGITTDPRADAAGEIGGLENGWTDEALERFGDRIVDIAERYVPGMKDLILGQSVVGPPTIAAGNPNAGPGDPFNGACQTLDFERPLPGHIGLRSPIPGLWMTGAATWPGPYVRGVSGLLVAQELIAEASQPALSGAGAVRAR